MNTTKTTLLSTLRADSNITKAYNQLKDMKSHKLSTVRASLKKAGIKHPKTLIFRLSRLLRTTEQKYIYIDYAEDIVQMYKMEKGEHFRNQRAGVARPVAVTKAKASKFGAKSKTSGKKQISKLTQAAHSKAVKAAKQQLVNDRELQAA